MYLHTGPSSFFRDARGTLSQRYQLGDRCGVEADEAGRSHQGPRTESDRFMDLGNDVGGTLAYQPPYTHDDRSIEDLMKGDAWFD